MLGEIDKDFYCSGLMDTQDCWFSFDKDFKPTPCKQAQCEMCRRKHPTPEQFKEEYGEEYPDNCAVYLNGWFPNGKSIYINGIWQTTYFANAKEIAERMAAHRKDCIMIIVCACTPWGKPPDEWRPE